MKYVVIFFICFWPANLIAQIPDGFVSVQEIIDDIEIELRYFTSNNFVGKPIDGYHANKLVLTSGAARALKQVHEELQESNLCLRVYDGYRPQRAVNHFVLWAREITDTITKQRYYPDVQKSNLFNEGYIASRSGHSRGSTVDLTIIDGNTGEPLDMGSPYDFFGEISWVNYNGITEKQQKNRNLLQSLMLKHGFRNYPKEWWHFTLRNEPFPNTYFDFLIE
ncbi:M15 family metallopeptidase [Algibacter mikhailovii]|uniref:D-alanyl-D-alanine dipeptidase n=1 Tax=Algibacter mikhailovii TaxID=425498 RepID=A0A918R267_9FLAO|nr:M15 family metallopeptidase [Algibacter mikhailovii]GGZ81396.1 D-alanyl-D-alanine dipeptidase [Algibacter mikhailovii]